MRGSAEQLKTSDPAEAAYFTGKAFEAEGDRQRALASYNEALPEDLTRATAGHVLLLLARYDLLASEEGQLDVPARYDAILRDADRAAELATDPQLKADPASPDCAPSR